MKEIGNAIGSNIFNVLFILGLTDTISPITTTGIMFTDTIITIVITIITYILAYDILYVPMSVLLTS